MITSWEHLNGKTIKGTYHGHGGVVLLLGDEFAVITAEMDYHNEDAYPALASLDNEDALYTACTAEAPGACGLLEEVKRQHDEEREKRERRRLAFLKEKYNNDLD